MRVQLAVASNVSTAIMLSAMAALYSAPFAERKGPGCDSKLSSCTRSPVAMRQYTIAIVKQAVSLLQQKQDRHGLALAWAATSHVALAGMYSNNQVLTSKLSPTPKSSHPCCLGDAAGSSSTRNEVCRASRSTKLVTAKRKVQPATHRASAVGRSNAD